MLKIIGALGLTAFITGCAFTPSSFNEANIDSLRIGMSSTEVREMFGAPNEVSVATCGGATAGGAWTCETWKYRTSSSYRTNNFVFSVQQNTKLLNSWDIKR
jgi:hypothetical protein